MRTKTAQLGSQARHDRPVRAALAELCTALQELYGQNAPVAILYGSHARGEATEASDIDVLLIYPEAVKRGQEIRRLSPILADLNIRHQVILSILPSARAEYDAAVGPFWSNIRREGVRLDAV